MGISTYITYRFRDKDPMIDQLRTILQDHFPGHDSRKISYGRVSVESGVSDTCLRGWFEGETRRPQFSTMCAVARAAGYDFKLIEIDKEKLLRVYDETVKKEPM